MKSEPIWAPVLVAAILAIGITAAWVSVAMTITAAFFPKAVFDLPSDSIQVVSYESMLFPSPAPLAVFQFGIVPLKIHNHPFAPLFDDIKKMMIGARLPFLIVCLLSAVLAQWRYRHQRRLSEHNATAWAMFVFVMGVPGLIGYLLHRRWPVFEHCQTCNKETPRDRDSCLHCGAEFPPPPMKGIEIFA
jgi:hypothetical protein